MKLLYYTVSDVSPQKGGTERITDTLCEYFTSKGIECFLAYTHELSDKLYASNCFVNRIQISETSDIRKVVEYLNTYKITNVIIQGSYTIIPLFRKAIDISGGSIQLLFVHHFNPGAETLFNNYDRKRIALKTSKTTKEKIINFLSIIKLPYTILYYNWFVRHYYKIAYEQTDKVVLLSKNFIPEWLAFTGQKDCSKFISIPNALTFSDYIGEEEIYNKKNKVLLVARFSENQKRIKLAIRIWKEIKKDFRSKGWSFHIVGSGIYEKEYKNIVSKEKIDDVFFEGLQNDTKLYYKESSLFFMTSAFEGWGLTLTEAQQMGCVPIAFNSYSSLTDIIKSKYNGIIIKEDDIDTYIETTLSLMVNRKELRRMALNASKSSKRFSKEKVAEMWINIFKS